MRTYEALYIIRPTLKDDEIQTVAKEVENLLTSQGGVIVRSEIWGKRKLAYKVQHWTEGCYVLLRFESDMSFVSRLDQYFRLSENIIRHLVVYFDAKTLRLEAEQAKRKQAEIAASAASKGDEEDEEDDRRRGRRSRRDRDDDDDD